MNTFSRAGEAMLLAQEGQAQLAVALWGALRRVAGRVAISAATLLSRMPGPHIVP